MLKTLMFGLVTVMCMSLIRSNQSARAFVQFDVLILVEQSIKSKIGDALEIYKQDLNESGFIAAEAEVNVTKYNNATAIRNQIKNAWNMHGISGCVLVGDIPYAVWTNGSSWATDYYYMDLNGTWTANETTGKFYNHTGHIRPEIWVSRLKSSTIEVEGMNETKLLNLYFQKNHHNRTASQRASAIPARALGYVVDNDMEEFLNDTVACLEKAYADVTIVNSTEANYLNYKSRLTGSGYNWLWLYNHGTPISHFAHKVTSSFYLYDSPKVFFYIWGVCGAAQFNCTNTLANSAVFGNGSGLVSVGLTASAAFPASWFNQSFEELRQRKCIGEAFKTMYNSIIDYKGGNFLCNNKFVLLGDPTLRINSPPYAPSEPDGSKSGRVGQGYTYNTSATDMNGDNVTYFFDWGDGKNTTKGPYNSGEEVNATHVWLDDGMYNVTVKAKDHPYEIWGDSSPPLEVNITQPHGGGCPFVYVWNGTQYVIDNNLLASSARSNGTEVEDYYRLEQRLMPTFEGETVSLYSLRLGEFQQEHSYLDQAKFMTVDHDANISVGVSASGEILTYQDPCAPVSAVDDQGFSWLEEISSLDNCYYEGYNGSYLLLDFGDLDVSEAAKLVIRADPPSKLSIHVQVFNSSQHWHDVATIIPRALWSTDIVDLSSYLPDANEELKVRLCFTDNHKVDYIGLDTTPQADIGVDEAFLLWAYHSEDGFVTSKLRTDNDVYAELEPSEHITLRFAAITQSGEERTFIIYVKGYYTTIS